MVHQQNAVCSALRIGSTGDPKIDHANVQRSRLAVDTIKWLVGKYAPRTYGDKPVAEPEKTGEITYRWITRGAPSNGHSIWRLRSSAKTRSTCNG